MIEKEVISSKQGITMMVMFIIGTTLLVGSANNAKQDAWIAILLSIAMAIPMISVYSRLLQLFPEKNLFIIIQELFGNITAKIIISLYTWYFFHLGALIIRNMTEFIQIVSFPETPQFFVGLFITLLTIYMVKSGIEVLGRWTEFVLPIILLIITLTVSLSTIKMNFSYIKPVLYNGFKPIFKSAFSVFTFPFAETIIFTVILGSLKQKRNPFKTYFLGLMIGGFFILIVSVRNILVLGAPSINQFYFPTYTAVTLISLGEFFQRIEVIVSIVFLLASIAKLSVCLFATSIGISTIFNFDDYKPIAAPMGLLMLNLSFILFSNVMEMFEWAEEINIYYVIPFQIILPILMLIIAEAKIRLGNLNRS